MGKIIVKNAVERKKGFIYYIDGEGNICEAKMAHNGKKSKKKITKLKATKKKSKSKQEVY